MEADGKPRKRKGSEWRNRALQTKSSDTIMRRVAIRVVQSDYAKVHVTVHSQAL